jgi:hypothetical protein
MVEDKELEYKYRANNIKLSDFTDLVETLGYVKKKEASSFDFYYVIPDNSEMFQRYRESDEPELTKKRKVKDTNNWERIEVDLPLDPKRITKPVVDRYVGLDGYEENFCIYKTCFIYFQDVCNLVYYAVYDKEMKEMDRFIEIEVNKDKAKELGNKVSVAHLNELEDKLSVLGITSKNRMKKSLYELYRK